MTTGSITHIRRTLEATIAAAVLVLAVACGGSAPPTPAAAPSSPPLAPTGAATTVTVMMTDYKLALDSTTLKPGAYVFHAVNAGQRGHALEVEGSGIEEQKTEIVGPGQSVDLAVTLPAGTFEMYCPVGNHKAMGMELDLTVA